MSKPTDDTKDYSVMTNAETTPDIHEESDNDLIFISFSNKGLQYEITPKFKNVLDTSRDLAEESTALLDGATSETIDEDELSRIRGEMKPVKAYRKDVDETLKDVRRVFNDTRDNFTGYIQNLLDGADFDVIEQNEEKAKLLNKDMLALRNKRNWDAVEEEYANTLETFPDLEDKFPRLLSFKTFANANEKVATGAKSWKLNDNVVNTIKTYIQDVRTNQDIIQRMNSRYEDELNKRYDQMGDVKAALDLDDQLKKEEAAALERQKKLIEQEAERKAKEIERKRIMEERAKQQAQAEAQRKAEEANKPKPAPDKNDPSGIADAPFGISTPAKGQPVRTAVQIADRVGFKKVAQRMQTDDWSLSSLESMDLLHRFLKGVYEQESSITELISSPDEVMGIVKEFVAHTS